MFWGNSCRARAILLSLAAAFASPAVAAVQRLDCVLTDTDEASAVEHRPIVILFDDESATMKLQEGARSRDLGQVSISMVSMSGGDADTTIGVSKSSWRVVVQTYQRGSVRTEFGVCTLRGSPPTSTSAR